MSTPEGIKIHDLRGTTVHSKEIRIKAGMMLRQHFHAFDHVSILARGGIELKRGGGVIEYHTGPKHLIIEAGIAHEIRAVTDAVWYCTHSAGSADANLNDFEG
jgi:quercetin dioxygenase-like cupin family protein